MCLISSQKEPLLSKSEIVCYKVITASVFHHLDPKLPRYTTPFQGIPINLNSLLIAKGCLCPTLRNGEYIIEEGMLHACEDIDSAQLMIKNSRILSYSMYSLPIIVKAIIPKNTRYFISKYKNEICAEQMFITDEFTYY